jgi:hypothetical protein
MTARRGALLRLAATIAVVLTATACTEGSEPVSTMSRAEAERRVEGYIQEAATRITPPPQLEVSSKNKIPCTEPGSANDGDIYAVEHTYQLRDHPRETNEQTIEAMKSYWASHGYKINKEQRDSAGTLTSVSAKRTDDQFYVRVWNNPVGDLFLVSSSTCVSDDKK